jgi:hypothetical protein
MYSKLEREMRPATDFILANKKHDCMVVNCNHFECDIIAEYSKNKQNSTQYVQIYIQNL